MRHTQTPFADMAHNMSRHQVKEVVCDAREAFGGYLTESLSVLGSWKMLDPFVTHVVGLSEMVSFACLRRMNIATYKSASLSFVINGKVCNRNISPRISCVNINLQCHTSVEFLFVVFQFTKIKKKVRRVSVCTQWAMPNTSGT